MSSEGTGAGTPVPGSRGSCRGFGCSDGKCGGDVGIRRPAHGGTRRTAFPAERSAPTAVFSRVAVIDPRLHQPELALVGVDLQDWSGIAMLVNLMVRVRIDLQ